MSNEDDCSFTLFVKYMCIYFILCVLAVPFGMATGYVLKYFLGL